MQMAKTTANTCQLVLMPLLENTLLTCPYYLISKMKATRGQPASRFIALIPSTYVDSDGGSS